MKGIFGLKSKALGQNPTANRDSRSLTKTNEQKA